MKCNEPGCSALLTKGNTFVLPLATIAAAAKKEIADLTVSDLISSQPVCEKCAFLHIMCEGEMVSWVSALETISRAKQAREDDAVRRQAAADAKVLRRDRLAAEWRGGQGLGALLLAQGLHPSPATASR